MIRKTLKTTKEATFVVTVPDKSRHNFPAPNGTGFFVSDNGYFITANHVVDQLNIGDVTDLERPKVINTQPIFLGNAIFILSNFTVHPILIDSQQNLY